MSTQTVIEGQKIGTGLCFPSGAVTVTDPCYTPGTWCTEVVEVDPDSQFDVWVRHVDDPVWGTRVAELALVKEGGEPRWLQGEEMGASIGVDSGQCGFVDVDHWEDTSDRWYDDICDGTGSKFQAVVDLKRGYAFSSSGIGDGSYLLRVIRKDGQVVQLSIDYFMDDEEE